ncbi:MAG: right-handed parallel beta-helix repeat-containing protein, partial [Deltaproteobacteria bacterium]|nr:right-handed parallel beta-helix repeat-containing protein [Deltaproteobacteria bacterium]
MQTMRFGRLKGILLFATCLLIVPGWAGAATKQRTCGPQPGQTIANFLDELNPGDTLLLSGTCNENVVIGEGHRNIIIDGQGTTTINAPDANASAVLIRGNRITLRGFTILGGRSGVHVTRGGTATVDRNTVRNAQNHGILVINGSNASITNNLVELNGAAGIQISENSNADIGFQSDAATVGAPNTVRMNGSNGIGVTGASHAEIEGNLVRENATHGISLSESSSARIGFQSGAPGSFAAANTVELNGVNGINVARSSSARIVENIIRNNTVNGVGVNRGSHADIANNKIDGNGGDGISVTQNSGVNLGADSGTDPEDLPNSTTTNNVGSGIQCRLNSYADGRLGTLNGAAGAKDFGRTFNVNIAMNGSDGNWGPVDEVDDA